MNYIITNKENQLIFSNIKNNSKFEQLINCKKNIETVICAETNIEIKQGIISNTSYNLYLSVNHKNLTNKIFKHYMFFYEKIVDEIIDVLELSKQKEFQKTRRLKHNLINHNSNILQELYKLFSQEKFKSGANHIDVIQEHIAKDTRKASFTFLKVLKNSNLMKAEFDVYDMLNKEDPYLDFYHHQIHKVVVLTLNPFWLDLIEKNITISLQPFNETTYIDYKSVSVALSHIFDNTTKYILPHSELKISFTNNQDYISIVFNMMSVKVSQDEIEEIFLENVSGYWTQKYYLSGDGIGMFMVNKLIKLNNGETIFKINQNETKNIEYMGIPYENNIIELKFKKL